MQVVSRKEFRKLKSSDTMVLYGSGLSIRNLTDEDKEQLSQFDSIAWNWFAKSMIPTTFYIVREQANTAKRTDRASGEDVTSFFSLMSSYAYKDACLIIHNVSSHTKKPKSGGRVYYYHKSAALNSFPQRGLIVNDIKDKENNPRVDKWKDGNFIKTGVYHGMCTLTNALHITVNMGYKRIIFVGVDLNDSRYFWLGKSKTRHTVKRKGHDCTHKHSTSSHVMVMVRAIKSLYPDIQMYVYSRKSMLMKVIPKWQWTMLK